jgi:TfoX/Sxy family transcriptional regulator of competence genes
MAWNSLGARPRFGTLPIREVRMNQRGINPTVATAKNPWRPVPPRNVAIFEQVIRRFPDAEPRRMFGCPCAFIQGNMFTGLHQESMIFRLSPEDRSAFLALPGATPFVPVEGRPMREYVAAPPEMLAEPDELERWMGRARSFARSLPPKAKAKR